MNTIVPASSLGIRWKEGLKKWLGENVVALAFAFAAALLVYSALATGVVFTNHTIPNAYMTPYPSFKTWFEGRWFADVLIHAFGGGSQAFEAVAGFAIQALNGVLFTSIFRVKPQGFRLLVATAIALHPTLLDYYSFTSDNITFTLGETFILIGVLLLDRWPRPAAAVVISALLFVLALGCYQPKIAVLGVVLICWTIFRLLNQNLREFWTATAVPGVVAFGSATVAYWLSTKLTIMAPEVDRTHLNSIKEIAQNLTASYREVATSLADQSVNLPLLGTIGLVVIVAGGVAMLIWAATRRGGIVLFLTLLLMVMAPPAIRLSYIVDADSWPNTGRLSVGYAYALGFLACIILETRFRSVGVIATIFAIYGFAIIGLQENSAMQMKTLYEQQAINRVLQRVEDVLPDDKTHPLVVIGDLPLSQLNLLVDYPNRPFRPQTWTPSFTLYRQVDIANFFLGQHTFTNPSQADLDAVLTDEKARPVWPLPGSVYMLGGVAVVVFAHAGPGVNVTIHG